MNWVAMGMAPMVIVRSWRWPVRNQPCPHGRLAAVGKTYYRSAHHHVRIGRYGRMENNGEFALMSACTVAQAADSPRPSRKVMAARYCRPLLLPPVTRSPGARTAPGYPESHGLPPVMRLFTRPSDGYTWPLA